MERKRVYTLIETLDKIEELNRIGFNCYIKGTGDGNVKIIIEEKEVTII